MLHFLADAEVIVSNFLESKCKRLNECVRRIQKLKTEWEEIAKQQAAIFVTVLKNLTTEGKKHKIELVFKEELRERNKKYEYGI